MAKPSSAYMTTTEEPNFSTDFTMEQQLINMTGEEHGGESVCRWSLACCGAAEARRARCSRCCVVAAAAAAAVVTTATSVIVTVTAGARGRSLRSSVGTREAWSV